MTDADPRAARRAERAAFDDDAVPLRPLDGAPPPPTGDDASAVDTAEDDDVVVLSWWQHPVNVIGLVVAVALIGGMLGWLIRDTSADERGDATDVGFLHDMRAHHEQAVEMAYTYLALEGTSPGLRTVAGSILVGQNIEVGRMIQMLREMGRPEGAESDTAMGWMGMPVTQGEMPGMATEDELDALAASSGRAADELFVQLMVAHHEGGLHMAEAAADDAGLGKVRSLARSIVTGQQSEIAELEQLLDP